MRGQLSVIQTIWQSLQWTLLPETSCMDCPELFFPQAWALAYRSAFGFPDALSTFGSFYLCYFPLSDMPFLPGEILQDLVWIFPTLWEHLWLLSHLSSYFNHLLVFTVSLLLYSVGLGLLSPPMNVWNTEGIHPLIYST